MCNALGNTERLENLKCKLSVSMVFGIPKQARIFTRISTVFETVILEP